MADAPTSSKMTALAAHGEKIALGTAAALLAGYLGYSLAFGGEDPRAVKLRETSKQAEDDLRVEHKELAPGRAVPLATLAQKPYAVQTAPAPGDAWAASYATAPELLANAIETGPTRQKLIASVSMGKAAVELGSITIHFEVVPVDTTSNDEAPLSRLIVERRTKGGAWTAIASKLAPDATSYADTTVEPKKDYEYRVTPVTEDLAAKNATKGVGKPSREVAATSMGIWKFTILSAFPDEKEEGKGRAYLKIEKFDKEHGKVEITRIHNEGDKIGFWDNTSVHRLSLPGGKAIEVDFNCGSLLKTIEKVEIKLKRKKCVTKRDNAGNKIGCDTVVEERSFTRSKVTIVDDEKKASVTLHPDTPVVEDEMCDEHKDKKEEPKK